MANRKLRNERYHGRNLANIQVTRIVRLWDENREHRGGVSKSYSLFRDFYFSRLFEISRRSRGKIPLAEEEFRDDANVISKFRGQLVARGNRIPRRKRFDDNSQRHAEDDFLPALQRNANFERHGIRLACALPTSREFKNFPRDKLIVVSPTIARNV